VVRRKFSVAVKKSRLKNLLISPGGLAEKIRFVIVGVFNTLLGFGMFALIQFLFGKYLSEVLVLLIAHVFASSAAFVLHRKAVFQVSGQVFLDYFRYQSIYVIPLGINLIVLPIMVTGMHINPYLAQGLITIVTVTISYVGHKYFSFRRARTGETDGAASSPAK
jgi:putative flippase GtrA